MLFAVSHWLLQQSLAVPAVLATQFPLLHWFGMVHAWPLIALGTHFMLALQ